MSDERPIAGPGRPNALIRLLSEGGDAEGLRAAREVKRARRRDARARAQREKSEWRLGLICILLFIGYGALALRMTFLAASEPQEPRVAAGAETAAQSSRAAIVDRDGRILATNLPVWSIYAHPGEMTRAGVTPEDAARQLAAALPGVDEATLRERFEKRKGLVWVKRPATPAERQAAHDLGLPGVHFGRREARLYPAGRIAAHVMGGARISTETVTHAEIVGRAGVERAMDEHLRDPARAGAPLELSIDLAAQTTLTRVMEAAMDGFNAKAASAVLMDADTGEIIAMVSLPDFDPNDRPDPNDPEIAKTRPMMNRSAEGVFELGSTFKLFTAAQALEEGFAGVDTLIDTEGPMKIGRFRIRDFHRMPPIMTLRDVIVESSNVGTSRLALSIGGERQRAFLEKFGFTEPTAVEIAEARLGTPLEPGRWGRIETATVSYGHGFAATQLHLASAYAALVNGGFKVRPTILKDGGGPLAERERLISAHTSLMIREMMRAVVAEERGTGNFAEVPGYEVGGKTGTADKPSNGGYDESRTITTFAGAFPMSAPEYVIVVTLDEAVAFKHKRFWRTAGWTAAPTAGLAVERLAPILGMRPTPSAVAGRADASLRVADR